MKEALDHYKRSNVSYAWLTILFLVQYTEAIKGHYEVISTNILRNSVNMPRNFDSNLDRFRVQPKGSQFALTTYNKGTLKTEVGCHQLS